MKNAIILDVDGVLLNWFDGFTAWMEKRGHRTIHGVRHTKSYDMTANFPELSTAEIDSEIANFNVSKEFGRLPLWPGALEGVENLREILPSWSVVALTAAGNNPKTILSRANAVMPFALDALHITPLGMSKQAFLQHYATGSIFVEDNLKHAITGADCGHHAILLDRPYNQCEHDWQANLIHRVNDWNGVIHRVRTLTHARQEPAKRLANA